MSRLFLLLCLITNGNFEMQTVRHFYMSRKTRSNSQPIKTGYVYSQVNNEPPKFSAFYNGVNDPPITRINQFDNSMKRNEKKLKEKCTQCFNNKYNITNIDDSKDAKSRPVHLNLAASNHEPIYEYDMNHDFHPDDEDVRTDSRNYDGWPYLYHSLYEYEPMNYDMEYEKAKDKRYVGPDIDKIIPVHENVDDIPNSDVYTGSDNKQTDMYTTDNPIYGNQPFFSYVLNDYYDKTHDDDPFNFKGISWENDFDHKIPYQDIYDSSKRKRRLDNPEQFSGHDNLKQSINQNGYESNQESEKSEKGNDNKHNYEGNYKQNGINYKGFKDFADAFVNKFGSEDQSKVAKYSIKNNADKGEKKKGFRKVYHKDEYQEHNEFFDDKNSSTSNEEHGGSKVHVGGSEALLRSQATAALGNYSNELNKKENVASRNFDKQHAGKQTRSGTDKDYKHYRDLAKNAALTNNADYFNI